MGTQPAFIDDVEDGKARVLAPDGAARTVALADLPPGAAEGATVQGGAIVPPGPDPAAATRAALGAGDTGGTIDLTAPVSPAEAGVDTVSGGATVPPGLPPSPGQAYIDSVISGQGAPYPAPAAAAPPPAAGGEIPGPQANGLPASSADLQKRILEGTEGEKKALEGVSEAKAQGQDELAKAQEDRDELRRQAMADEAAHAQYVRDRQQKLDDEDAANLQKARDTVIPDFWQSRPGQLAGAAVVAGLSGAAGALLGTTHNAALEAIQHNVDSYYTQQRQKIDNLYKYAEAKGQLNEKVRHRYASELTDLMQQHAYTLQAAADRIQEVSDRSKGLVDQAQVKVQVAQLQKTAAEELQKARAIDEKNYDLQTASMNAEANQLRAKAAMAKAHKGAGGGGASGTDWMTAARDAAQQPGATELSVAKAARDAGFKGKDTTLKGFAATEIANVGKQTEGTEKQMIDFEKQLNGAGGKLGPAAQLSRIQAMKGAVKDAAASGDPDRIKAAITAIKEEAGGMLSGGKTTQYTGHMLQEAQSLEDKLKSSWSKIRGNPTEGAHFVSAMGKLLDTVEGEKLQEVHEIRQKAVDQVLGPGGTANSPAAKRHAMARFKGITGTIRDSNGNPVYEEGGAKPAGAAAAPSGPVEGARSKTAKGVDIVFKGGKWVKA